MSDKIIKEPDYKRIFQEMLEGFALHEVICDANGKPVDYRFLNVNESFKKITGTMDIEVVGRTVLEIFPATEAYWIETYGNVANTGENVWFEHYSRAVGKTFEVRAFLPEKGMFATIFTDITARVEMEKLLKDETEFIRKENLSKSLFLGNISHEIRTPVNSILGAMVLLESTDIDEEQSSYIQIAKRSSEILISFVDNILNLSKIEAGKMEIQKNEFYIEDVIKASWELLSIKAMEKSIRFNTEISESASEKIVGDAGKITQILVNLFSNAVKFTSHGSITLRAYNEYKNEKDNFIVIEVEDTGIGMSSSFIDVIFTPFSQENRSDSFGSGLGLSIAKELVELLGGEISVKSEIGKGSIFRFSFTKL